MFFKSSGLTCAAGWLASRMNVDGGCATAIAAASTTAISINLLTAYFINSVILSVGAPESKDLLFVLAAT